MREIATGLVVTCVAAIVTVGGWMLAFLHIAVVPDGVTRPQGWFSFTSGEQVTWLRTHTEMLSGIDAMIHIAKHFSDYSSQVMSMLGIAWVAAAMAIGAWWYLTGDNAEQAEDEDDAAAQRYARRLSDKQ